MENFTPPNSRLKVSFFRRNGTHFSMPSSVITVPFSRHNSTPPISQNPCYYWLRGGFQKVLPRLSKYNLASVVRTTHLLDLYDPSNHKKALPKKKALFLLEAFAHSAQRAGVGSASNTRYARSPPANHVLSSRTCKHYEPKSCLNLRICKITQPN